MACWLSQTSNLAHFVVSTVTALAVHGTVPTEGARGAHCVSKRVPIDVTVELGPASNLSILKVTP